MNFFQRKNSKRVKEADGSPKDKDSRGKSDRFDRAKAGLETLAGNIQSAKNDAEAGTQKLQGDLKSGIDTIMHTGSGILEKARTEFGSHSEGTRSKELEQGSGEEGGKNMEAFSAVLDKVKSNPEVVDKVKEEVMNLGEKFHLTKHESKETESEEKAKDGEATQNADESTSGKTEDLAAVQHAAEEIQAFVAGVQQQTARDETEPGASTVVAAAEASAEGEKPEATTTREVEKDDPTKRTDFFGFVAMLFERCCSPAKKKID
jgi:regulator of RNase E activity RraB